jgi:plastocyanin
MDRHRLLTVIPVLFLAACSGGSPEARKEDSKKEVAPAAVPAGQATVTGKILFTGAKPAMRPLTMDAVPACLRMHKEAPKSEEVLINPDGSLRNVFVRIKDGLPAQQWPVPASKVTVDQNGCIYKPPVVGVMVGQDIEFLNNDETNHNIHPLPRTNREWNESQPPKGDPKVKQFTQEEMMIPVKCNVHPWMRLYVSVVSHPFFDVTSEDGTFTIKGLPAGDYTVEAIHERYGAQEMKVKVDANGTAKADFTFKG